MADDHDLPSDSDESDDDYVPEGAEEALSEEDSDGVSENELEDNDENKSISKKRRKSKTGKSAKRKKKVESNDSDTEESKTVEKKQLSEEEEKHRADLLWADFMKDTDTVPKPKEPSESTTTTNSSNSSNENSKAEETVKVTKIFEFAGEEVTVEKEVPVTMLTKPDNAKRSPLTSENLSSVRGRGGAGMRRGVGSGGISSVLGQLGKKAKISTLEKSKLDWENFKKQQNLQDEISSHNKGKDGYLERQDFLERADLRQFEIEKQMRSNSRRSTR